jgi:dipeptidyl aminopeptidase/acylaminoacyl peptidase
MTDRLARFRALGAALVCLLLTTAPVSSAEKHAITHEDVWLMKRLGAPIVSPDGRRAIVSVTEPAYARKDQSSDLWLLTLDGSQPPRKLTQTKGSESGVAWSPDSQRIAFSAKRDGDTEEQIYVLDLVLGGEAARVTNAPLGARAPHFSPEGRRISYVSEVWPGAKDDADNRRLAKERTERKANVRIYEGFPIRHWDHWLDERRPHLFVQAIEPGAEARDLLAGTKLAALPGFMGRIEDDGLSLQSDWTPDGRGLVFAASADHDQAARAFTSQQLWYVPATGGEPLALTSGRDTWSDPRVSPDGRALYALHERETAHVYVNTHIARLPIVPGSVFTLGTGSDVTATLDKSVSSWGVTASDMLYYLAEDAGLEKLYVAAPGQPARLSFQSTAGVYSGLSVATRAAKPVLVARWESAVHPPEIVRLDGDKGPIRLTDFNVARAERIDWAPVEHFWFKDPHGQNIHSLLVKPPGFDPTRKYPLFVVIHGGPASMWRDQFVVRWNYHLLAKPGYVLVLTDYAGSTGYGEGFAQAIERDPLAGPAEQINAAADEAIRRYGFIDGSRQCAGGASYGGHLSNWMQASTTRYKCLVSHAGLVSLETQWGTSDSAYHREVTIGSPPWANDPLWRTQSPLAYADRFKTPVLLSVGENDFRVPINNTLEYWTALQRQQVPSRLLVFPEENHWITRGDNSRLYYEEIAAWLAKYLGTGNTG